MKFSDETLMAYADGELDEATRNAVERAIRSDPSLAAKVRQHTAMRSNVYAAFAPIIDEQVPPRLSAATKSGKVIQLNTARGGARAEPIDQHKRHWSWKEWGGIAAALIVGVLAGGAGVSGLQDDAQLAASGGALVATGDLAKALSQQLAGAATSDAAVRIGVSFAAKDGGYCRSFTMGTVAGLACRNGDEWKVPLMAEAAKEPAGAYRQAASAIPPAVLDAIDERMTGQTLDSKAEEAARERGWKR